MDKHAKRASSFLEKMTLGRLRFSIRVVAVLLLISTGWTMWELGQSIWAAGRNVELILDAILDFLYIFPLIGLLLLVLGSLFLLWYNTKHRIGKLRQLIPNWQKNPEKYINRLRLGDLLEMGILRGASVSVLTSTIYMNRIRGLGYAVAYSRADLKNRVLDNEIFTLQVQVEREDEFESMLRSRGAWPPPAEMARVVGKAATMPTKLWIEQDEGDPLNDLDYLVAAGQATTCYNLMRHMWEECREEEVWMDPETEKLFEHALTEWKKLIADPLSLLKDRKSKSRLVELNEQAAAM